MAAQFIYGCVNPDRTITFLNTTTPTHAFAGPCEISGCIVRDGGEHDQQVAVAIANLNCNDTYYGCINWTTKKFKVSVPEECALLCCPCSDVEDLDQNCYATDAVPTAMYIKFSGVKYCDDSLVTDINDVWICLYKLAIPRLKYRRYDWISPSGDSWDIACYIENEIGKTEVWALNRSLSMSYFVFYFISDTACLAYGVNQYDCTGSDKGKEGYFIAIECSLCRDAHDWETFTDYTTASAVLDPECYVCIQNHNSGDGSISQPGTGTNWTNFWDLIG